MWMDMNSNRGTMEWIQEKLIMLQLETAYDDFVIWYRFLHPQQHSCFQTAFIWVYKFWDEDIDNLKTCLSHIAMSEVSVVRQNSNCTIFFSCHQASSGNTNNMVLLKFATIIFVVHHALFEDNDVKSRCRIKGRYYNFLTRQWEAKKSLTIWKG